MSYLIEFRKRSILLPIVAGFTFLLLARYMLVPAEDKIPSNTADPIKLIDTP